MVEGLAVRWLVSNDLKDIASIEKECFIDPWSPRQVKRAVRGRDSYCLIAEVKGVVVGYLVWAVEERECSLTRIAVSPFVRLCGIGEALVDKLVASMLESGCRRIEALVHEENMTAQFFFREIGFKGMRVLREFDVDGTDWYLFEMRLSACEFQGKPRFSFEVGGSE